MFTLNVFGSLNNSKENGGNGMRKLVVTGLFVAGILGACAPNPASTSVKTDSEKAKTAFTDQISVYKAESSAWESVEFEQAGLQTVYYLKRNSFKEVNGVLAKSEDCKQEVANYNPTTGKLAFAGKLTWDCKTKVGVAVVTTTTATPTATPTPTASPTATATPAAGTTSYEKSFTQANGVITKYAGQKNNLATLSFFNTGTTIEYAVTGLTGYVGKTADLYVSGIKFTSKNVNDAGGVNLIVDEIKAVDLPSGKVINIEIKVDNISMFTGTLVRG